MRIKDIYKSALLATTLLAVGCTSEEVAPDANVGGRTVEVQLTVNREGAMTRASLAETSGEDGTVLSNLWESGDVLRVYDSNGDEAGTLTILDGVGSANGIFTGTLTNFSEDAEYCLWYIDEKANSIVSIDNENKNIVINVKEQSFKSVADLEAANVMSAGGVKFAKAGSAFSIDIYSNTADVTMEPKLAMAHFALTGIAGKTGTLVLRNGKETSDETKTKITLKLNGENGDGGLSEDGISIAIDAANTKDNATHVYAALLPSTYQFNFTFTDASDSKVYTYSSKPEVTNSIIAGKYYTAEDGSAITVTMTESGSQGGPSDNEEESDLTGPVFSVNNKTFRFTRANLRYNYETEEWSLFDNQYDYLCQAGWTYTNGTWGKTVDYKEKLIDIFGYGATGLYDVESDAYGQNPTFWKNVSSNTTSPTFYPSTKESYNKGYAGSYLDAGIQFSNFDYGKAYYLSINKEQLNVNNGKSSYDEALKYFTLSSSDWNKIISGHFISGCTIRTDFDNPVNALAGKNIYGILIFKVADYDSAKSILLNVSDQIYVASKDNNYLASDYDNIKVNLDDFKKLEASGYVVFIPEAGHRAVSLMTKDDGYYWTSSNGQSNTAIALRFEGTEDVTHMLKTDPSTNRGLGCAVRLVREVKPGEN